MMTVFQIGKRLTWRPWSPNLQETKLQPSACFKATVLVILIAIIFVSSILQQGTMLRSNARPFDAWSLVVGSSLDSGWNSYSSSSHNSDLGEPVAQSNPRDAACLSRTLHMRHRPRSQVVPSNPALMSALDMYDKHHAECSRRVGGNWTEAFLRSMDRVPENQSDHETSRPDCMYLVYMEGGVGLGNRLIGLVTAFLYALLTNRVLLLDTKTSKGLLAQMLCEPFLSSSWLLPDDFPIEMSWEPPDLGKAIEDDFNNTDVLRLNLDMLEKWGDKRFFCAETRERIEPVVWVAWISNQYFVPRLFTFPEFWPRLATLFPDASLVFTHLSRHLLLPNNAIWEKIFRIYSSYLASADKQVGMQIRRHWVKSGDSGEFSPAALNRFLQCLVDHQVLPVANQSSDPKGSSFSSEHLLELMETQSRPPTEEAARHDGSAVTTVLITSLQQRYAEELQHMYTDYPTTDGSLVRVHMVSHEGMESHSDDQFQKAFVEMWLLSLSDVLATSSWSTFGYIAQGLGAIRPYLVDIRGDFDQSDDLHDLSTYCLVGQSPEPCNHAPLWPNLVDCGNASDLTPPHQEWIQRVLGRCQDWSEGLQLH